ncbi:MAG: Arc family DNA-binding protein [Chitinophagaceae bacterium]|jgi:hypothetical protein
MAFAKKTFVLRISEDTFNALSKWAEDEFRSVNGQIEMILDKSLKEVGRKKDDNTFSSIGKTKMQKAQ